MYMTSKSRLFWAGALLACGLARALQPNEKPLPEQRPVNEFLPYSYLQAVPYKFLENIEPGNHYSANAVFPYYFEGGIAPILIVYETQTRTLQDSTDGRAYRVGFDLSITPEIDIRMYNTPSLPIRHPSYKPQVIGNLTYYFPNHRDGKITGVHKLNFQLKAEHYSNGDEGCLFQEDSETVEFKNGEWRKVCQSDSGKTINNLDGEFSSTFFTVGAYYHYSWLGQDGTEKQAFRSHLLVDLQPYWLRLPGSAVPTQQRIYNPDFKLSGYLAWYSRTFEIFGGFKYFASIDAAYFPMIVYSNDHDLAPYVTPYDVDLKLGWLPDNKKILRGWSFYGGFYGGQDPYNVEFRHKVAQVDVGLMSTSSLQFRMR